MPRDQVGIRIPIVYPNSGGGRTETLEKGRESTGEGKAADVRYAPF